MDIVIENNKIVKVQNVGYPGIPINESKRPQKGDYEIDAAGMYILPGFVDLHIHSGNQFKAPDAEYTYKLFERGTEIAEKHGLILVDTKYEFGKKDGEIYLIDEIHTPDSSRYFYLDTYQENFDKGLPQKQLSKEFLREWLMEKGFQGREGDVLPEFDDDIVKNVSDRYIELYEIVTGKSLDKINYENIEEDIKNSVEKEIKNL